MRHGDQAHEWGFDSYVAQKRRGWSHSRPLRTGLFVTLILLCVGGWYFQHRRDRVVKALLNQTRATETQIELAVIARVTRDFRIGEGRYPQDFQAFLRRSLRPNKPFPVGTDFWGRPYRLELEPDGFVVRSAGADGRYQTRDDLICQATVRE